MKGNKPVKEILWCTHVMHIAAIYIMSPTDTGSLFYILSIKSFQSPTKMHIFRLKL